MSATVLAGDQAEGPPAPVSTTQRALDLLMLLGLALGLRLLTYNGIFGSDDGTYFDRALDVANGTWSSANYNGALRYGFNIPAGGFLWLFGSTPFVANLWPLLCSLIEVTAVYAMAVMVMGRRAGLFAGLLLATAPLHIAVATRIHADPVVSMFITLAFLLLWAGWVKRSKSLLFASGLSLGGIFWAKELVGIVWLAFVPMLWMFRGRWREAAYVIAGALLMLALHGLLMTWIAGHPLHLIRTVLGQVQTNFIEGMQGEDAAAYYLTYLFVDLRHTGLIAIIAVLGLWWVPRRWAQAGLPIAGFRYVLVWALGLLLILSVFPVSLSPLRFVMKQSNYITLFLGGMAVLGGLALASMSARWAVALAFAAACLGVWLGALQQADYRAFAAGSKALGQWVASRGDVVVVGSTNNASLGNLQARLLNPAGPRGHIRSFRGLGEKPSEVEAALQSAGAVYVSFDLQTRSWAMGRHAVMEPQPCWGAPVETLRPADLGFGNQVAGASAALATSLSAASVPGMRAAARAFGALAHPVPVALYRIESRDVLCRG